MVNSDKKISTKAHLLMEFRKNSARGMDCGAKPLSGNKLAKSLGISRVAVWKAVQSLTEAGYKIETSESGYFLDPDNDKDFIFPWEFPGRESFFRYYENTTSTMDRARELAALGAPAGTVVTAEKQSAGRGRNGRTWISRKGGLFFTILDRPAMAIADYVQYSLILQIAAARCISTICGKKAFLRWPNDVYIMGRKISGIMTEVCGEGDLINWISGGIGVNVNNYAPSGKITSCAEISGRQVSRREVLTKILDEIVLVKQQVKSGAAYAQGNRNLAAQWNSMSDNIGSKAAIIDQAASGKQERVLARGVFEGIDPAGRCILKTGNAGNLYFNPGPVSMIFTGNT